MMKTIDTLPNILGRVAGALAFMAGCLMASSCVQENIIDPTPEVTGDVWLSVDIANMAPGMTRAGEAPDDTESHPEEDAEAAENYIDPSDVEVYILTSAGRLTRPFDKDKYSVTKQLEGVYRLTLQANAVNFDLSGDNVSFKILMIANLTGTGDGHTNLYTLADLNASLADMTTLSDARSFGFQGNVDPSNQDFVQAPPKRIGSQNYLTAIPMSGIVTATVTKAALAGANTEANPVQLPTIYMMRALAQIRVVDAITNSSNANAEGWHITYVHTTGVNKRGAYLPEIGASSPWLNGTSFLENGFSLSSWYDPAMTIKTQKVTYTDAQGYVDQMQTSQTYPAFRCYVPELDRSAIAAGAKTPAVTIGVADTKGNTAVYTYEFPATRTENGTTVDFDFARNHIYQLVVTGVSADKELTINYTICPWDVKTTDIPEFN